MPSCGWTCGRWTTASQRPAPRCWTASRSRRPKPAARGGSTRGKKIAGRKRHVLVDTLGLIWALAVLPADTQDRDGAKRLFIRLPDLPRLAVVWADGAYQALVEWVGSRFGWVLTTVLRPLGVKGYVHLPKR